MGYDEAIQKAEAIVKQLEQAEAISMEEYKRLASGATTLLKHCKSLLTEMHKDISVGVENL